MNRRKFIQSSSLSMASALITPSLFAGDSPYKNKIGLQLYSLRDIIDNDPKKVLSDVATYGYKELETYGYKDGKLFGLTVKDYADHVKSLGMKTISGHYGMDIVTKGWEKACADAKLLGQEYVVVPHLSESYYKTMNDLKKTCDIINKGAEVARKMGLRMGYHNHAFEFKQIEGQLIFEVMLKEFDPKLVSMELDLFWVVNARQNPIKFMETYPGRFEQWHVKDMDRQDRKNNADVGTGSIDFNAIFAKAKLSGMKHFYIEQETYPISSSESVKASIQNLLKII